MKLRHRLVYRRLYEELRQGSVLLGARRKQHLFVPSKPRWTTHYLGGRVMNLFLAQRGVYAVTAVEVAALEATVHFPPRDLWSWFWDDLHRRFYVVGALENFRFGPGYVHILPGRHFQTAPYRDVPSIHSEVFRIPDSQLRGLVYCVKRPVVPSRVIQVPQSMVCEWLTSGHLHRFAESV